ncbi:MAG: YfhO family protein [Chloroflexi bacterium]|nr:YfhO family protein [Chloroflexota bacterium]
MKFTRSDLIALLLILVVALAFTWPIFTSNYIIPQGGGDLVSFLWPNYRYATQHLNLQLLITNPQSLIPNLQSLLWNPTLYSGTPFIADNQNGFFYPPNLIAFLLFPDLPYKAMEILVAFHLFLAGAGMYLFMRYELLEIGSWKLEVGLFPAIAYMASDIFIIHLGNLNTITAPAYLPLVFLGLRQALKPSAISHQPSANLQSLISNLQLLITNYQLPIRWSIFSGLMLGLSLLAGQAQMVYIVAILCGIYGLYELITQRHTRVILLGSITIIVALGLSAIALLPALELVRLTARTALSYAEASRYSLHPLTLSAFFNPTVIGRGARDFWLPIDRAEIGYLGVTTLALVGLARKPKIYFVIALIGGVLALGAYTPVHQLLFQILPGFASFRAPARFILLTSFSLAILSGYALADLRKEKRALIWCATLACFSAILIPSTYLGFNRQLDPTPLVITFTLILIACVSIYFNWRKVLVLTLFIELFSFGAFVEVDRLDSYQGYKRTPAVDYLLAQPGPLRIDLATTKWQPDSPAVFGLESIYGIFNPLLITNYYNYYWSVDHRGSPRYNFLNAQYVVADKDKPPADSTFIPVFNEDPDVDIYLNTNAMQRVSLIYDAILTDDPAKIVFSPNFNPTTQVILESPITNYQLPISNLQSPISNLFHTEYRAGHFTVVAQTSSPAYLVFSEVWYPSWTATINGKPTTILKANTAFMAVEVPAGENTVTFNFTSPTLMIGVIITLLTLIASIYFLFFFKRTAT